MDRPVELDLLSISPFENLEQLENFLWKREKSALSGNANKKELTFQGVRQPTALHLQACHSSEPLDGDPGGALVHNDPLWNF